uniref:Variant surface glycoprotein 1125.4030 n=1 Tax=Trypanosoma brucei TaxID=5691 RepID=A0A1J0R9U1_9TRYP|nr:variant surface glycoprotein 1125.4030 [Trypanosoma brucei]
MLFSKLYFHSLAAKNLIIVWTVIPLILIQVIAKANKAENNSNRVEFSIFCEAINMLGAEQLEEGAGDNLDGTAAKAWTEIERVFIMTANATYFESGPEPKISGAAESKDEKQKRIENWKTQLSKWKKTTDSSPAKQPKYVRKPRETIAKAIGAKIDELFKTAKELHQQIDQTNEDLADETKNVLKSTRKALVGAATDGTTTTKPTAQDANFQGTYTAACSQADTVGKHITNDIVCLCAADTGTATNSIKMCTQETTTGPPGSPYTSINNGKAIAIYLTALCNKIYPTPKLTAANIATFILAFTKQLGKTALNTAGDKGSYVFGKGNDHATPCAGGAESDQNCVDYKNQVTVTSSRGLGNGILWMKELQAAAGHLVKRKKLIRQKESEQTRMIFLAEKMQELYQEALHAEQPPATQKHSQPQATPDSDKQRACEKLTNKTTCEAKSCKWNGTEETIGKCEAKPEEEQKSQGTGEKPKEGTATSGCTTHKDKTACENEKKMASKIVHGGRVKRAKMTKRHKNAEMVVFSIRNCFGHFYIYRFGRIMRI